MTGAHRFDPTILREYDVRGVVGETLSDSDAYALGRAFGTMVREAGGGNAATGYDGRLSSPALERALVEGLRDCGVAVWRIGLGPTPMLYYATVTLGADAGVMVTGSHNPPDHNGFKLMLGKAGLYGAAIERLGRIAAAGAYAGGAAGEVRDRPVMEDYVSRLAADDGAQGRALTVAWDAGNGATGTVLTRLTPRLPGRHILLNETIDGRFPAHHPDPTVAENLVQLQETVRAGACDLGIGLDGDGDRLGVVDGTGAIVWGDQLLALFARDVLARRPGATIVADVKSSRVLFDEIRRAGGVPLMWRSGHSLIKSKMAEVEAPLAGELSGHVFFADGYYGFDDALYAAVRLLRILSHTTTTLAEMRAALPAMTSTPELRFPCAEDRKFAVVEEAKARLKLLGASFSDIDGVRVESADGWWLLRASNTEGALVARCEATDAAALGRLRRALAEQLRLSGVALPPGL